MSTHSALNEWKRGSVNLVLRTGDIQRIREGGAVSRGDKRTQFAPYVPIWIKETVVSIGKHLNMPMGDTARALVMEAHLHSSILDTLAPYMWRALRRGNHMWPGHNDREDIKRLIEFPYERCERLKFRVTLDDRRLVDDLLIALACPADHMMAALLLLAVQDKRIVHAVAPRFEPRSRYSI